MKRSALLILSLLVSALPAMAQQLPARLTLEDALRIARERNPAYLQVLNDVGVAAANQRAGWGAFLPSLDASLSFNGSRSKTRTGQDDYGEPIRRDEFREYTSSGTSQGIGLGLTLFEGGARLNALRAARAEGRIADARVATEGARLQAEVSRRYYAAVRAERLIELEERLLAAARDRLERTQQMLRVVAAGPVDVLGAQVEVAQQAQAVEQARGEARKGRLMLLEVMGVDQELDFELAAQPVAVFDPTSLDTEALLAAALRRNPRILEGQALVAAADEGVGMARARRWPTVSANASFGRSMRRSGSYDALFKLNPRNWSIGFGLSVSLPLFSQFQTSAEVARADAAAEDAQEALRATRLLLERELRSALIDLENAHRSFELAQRSADLSRQRVELAQEQYRAGLTSFIELQTVIEQAAEAERGAIGARFDFVNALVTLEERVGREVRP